jgi:hypothetical protein
MLLRRLIFFLACFTLFGCPNNGPPVPEDPIDGGPCSEEFTQSLSAGAWKGSSFEALQDGDSPEIEFGSQGGVMARMDLLATGVGSKAQGMTIELRSLDGTEVYTEVSFSSVSFACQNQAGQVLVDMTIEVDSVPFNELVILFIEATFEVENGDSILVQSEIEIVLSI